MVVNAPLVLEYNPAKMVFKDRVYAEETQGPLGQGYSVHVHEKNWGESQGFRGCCGKRR